MFTKLMENSLCMKVIAWLLNHSINDYEAALVAYDCGITEIDEFMAIVVILNETGMVAVEENSETLRIVVNDNSPIFKKFKELQTIFDEEAYRSSDVSAAFVGLSEMERAKSFKNNSLVQEGANNLLHQVEVFKEDESQVDLPSEIVDQLKNLKELGQLDEFEEFLQKYK